MTVLKTETLAFADRTIDGLLCVDLEDWHQLLLRRYGRGPKHCSVPFRRGLDALLSLLAESGQQATFFVLGMTLAEEPSIVSDLMAGGHEIATHGWEHIHLERRSNAEFAEDLKRAVGALSDLTGERVLGHRAPEFSIPREAPQAFFDTLTDQGLLYDSSVYPFAGGRYGLPDFPKRPCRVRGRGGDIIEFPLATAELAGRPIPIGGGGYWRLLPAPLLEHLARRARSQDTLLTTYVHNYEFDPERLNLTEVASAQELSGEWRRTSLQQNLFRRSLPGKLRRFLKAFRLVPCRTFLESQGLLGGD